MRGKPPEGGGGSTGGCRARGEADVREHLWRGEQASRKKAAPLFTLPRYGPSLHSQPGPSSPLTLHRGVRWSTRPALGAGCGGRPVGAEAERGLPRLLLHRRRERPKKKKKSDVPPLLFRGSPLRCPTPPTQKKLTRPSVLPRRASVSWPRKETRRERVRGDERGRGKERRANQGGAALRFLAVAPFLSLPRCRARGRGGGERARRRMEVG